MKKLNLLTVLIMLAFVSVSFGQKLSDPTNPHNFTGKSWNDTDEICITCHTPHNAIAVVEPLWNHTLSTSAYTLYSSITFDGDETIVDPDGSSKLCLSCHDGTIALDNFGGNGGSAITTMIGGNNDIGIDLSDDHPISFDYAAAVALDDELIVSPSGITFEDGKMQCSSCHDVHNATHSNLLVLDNAASALCLTCHNK